MQIKAQRLSKSMSYVEINCDTIAYWQQFCNQSLDLLAKYKILINSYVLEFFSEDLWNAVPQQWRAALSQLSPQQLSAVLRPPGTAAHDEQLLASVLPLSFLAFRAAAFNFSLPRTAVSSVQPFMRYLGRCDENNFSRSHEQTSGTESRGAGGRCAAGNNPPEEEAVPPPPGASGSSAMLECLRPAWPSDQPHQALWQTPDRELCQASGHHTLLSHVFRRHLKPKKQHEVARLALVAALAARATDAALTADIGGGCGHLARLMAYGYDMEVVCVDREAEFVRGARKFDTQLEQSVQKLQRRLPQGQSFRLPPGPRHAACLLRPGLLPYQFVESVVSAPQSVEKDFIDLPSSQGATSACTEGVCRGQPTTFGLTGLHTCGDLAPLMLRLFLTSPQCCYVASVACCYMKLSAVEGACADEMLVATAHAAKVQDENTRENDGVEGTTPEIHDQTDEQHEINSKQNTTVSGDNAKWRTTKNLDDIKTKLERFDPRTVEQNFKEENTLETFQFGNSHHQVGTDSLKDRARSSTASKMAQRTTYGVKELNIKNENGLTDNAVYQNEIWKNHVNDGNESASAAVDPPCCVEYISGTSNKGDVVTVEKHDGVRGDGEHDGVRGDGEHDGGRGDGEHDGVRGDGEHDGVRGDGEHDGVRGDGEHDGVRGDGEHDGVRGDGAAEELGYPMSRHCSTHPQHQLSYAARELSCHALEAYADRLGQGADNLKVHCYRAALEQLLVRHYPQHRRAGLRPVRHAHTRAFHEYAKSAVSALDGGRIKLPEEELKSLETEEMLARWHQVIVFYSLRLLLAPVIETVILLDRCFFLYENGVDCTLVPAFDPKLSPRNMILLAAKRPR